MRYLAVLLVLSTFLFSCKKKYHIVGRVFNPITGEGIANAKVKFSRTTFDAIPGGDEEVANTLTDSNGNYDLEFKGRAEVVKLEVDASLYELGTLKEGVYQQALQLEAKKTMEVNWHAVPYGLYNAHVENINCAGPNDSMQLRKIYQYDDYGQYWSPYRLGCYNSTSTEPLTLPMGYYYFETKVTRSGVTTYVYDTVFVNGLGTSFLEILY